MPSFVPPRYFCLSPPLYFSALHDRLIFNETPSFPRLRQDSLFLTRHLLLLRHNTFNFTALPSFVAPRYFWFHRDAFFLMYHDTLWFARTPFACKTLTPLFSGGRNEAQSSERHKTLHEARCWKLRRRPSVRCNTALNYSSTPPRFYSRLQVHFLFFPRLCFLLFHASDFTQLLIFATSLFIHSTYFAF